MSSPAEDGRKMLAVNANFLHYCLSIVLFMKRESENLRRCFVYLLFLMVNADILWSLTKPYHIFFELCVL